MILIIMGEICKLCEKDGWHFATQLFTNSSFKTYPKFKVTGTYTLPASTEAPGAGGVTRGVLIGASGDNGTAGGGDSGFFVVSDSKCYV